MDEATRERYRRSCREAAPWSEHSAVAVAQEAIRLGSEHDVSEPRGRHVGAWLLAEGRVRLEARLGCRVPRRERAIRFLRRHAQGAYVGSILILTGLALLGVERLLAMRGVDLFPRLTLLALLSLSVLDFFEESAGSLLMGFVPGVEPLPRLEPSRVFTQDTRTLVVTPLLVTCVEDIEAQLRMLEINYLGNVEPGLFFALLTDFRDAPEKDMPPDGELRERLERGIRELNERHGYREQPRFFCLHRERRWNPVAGRWMGWERKRGKLDEFNRLVLGAQDTSYVGPVPEVLRTVRYVITLDADTHLLPGDAARLVAILHHPLNQARFDASGRRVVAGYSMIQPALSNEPTREIWLSSGGWPLSIVREKKNPPQGTDQLLLYQSLFGTGYFLGKGLYDVAAFTRSLEGRLPENTILSHDKLEGMYARVAYTQDITLLEGRPAAMTGQARIWHRWIRGDWQVLPWLLPRVPSQEGRRHPNILSLLDRWHLLVALRASLTFPSTFFLFAFGWLFFPGSSAGAWTMGVLLWNRRNQLVNSVVGALRMARRSGSFFSGLRAVAVSIPLSLGLAVMNVALLLPATGLALDAIGRALYGLTFDRSRMLDWTTHAQTNREARGLRALLSFPEVWGALVLSLGMGGALAVFNPGALPWAAPLLLAWVPMLVMFARQGRPPAEAPAPPHVEQMRAMAHNCWELYQQTAPKGGELSPTDMALGLVAPLSAYHLGCLGREELVSRLGACLEAMEGLERHRGHLLARYAQAERRPVGPRRVSTAESGVVAAALLVVERGLHAAREGATPGTVEKLEEVEGRARKLREGMEFGWLYDGEAGLMHTGYDVGAGALEAEHHGLLTSGAMLAGFVAIASRQVPLKHWAVLVESDQRLRAGGAREMGKEELAEHLLPTLFVWFPPATLLGQAAQATLERSREAERQDAGAAPRSVLALRFQPERAVEELRRVAQGGQVEPREQAMALAAVANLTYDDILVRHFHQHWRTAWVEALVFETQDTR